MYRKLSSRDLQAFRDALLQARAVLEDDMNLLAEDALGRNGMSQSDVVEDDSGYDQEISLGLLERDGTTLREIAEALQRIDSGGYGVCEGCQEPIGRPRLKALPHTRHCIDCKRALEGKGL